MSRKQVAILAAHGFELSELKETRKALEKAGFKVSIISPEKDTVKGWQNGDWAEAFPVDVALEQADPKDYDALLLPGGVINPDKLRMQDKAINFIKTLYASGKPIAAICHAPWLLIDTGIAKGRKVTSYPSVKTDLINAGAQWVDEEAVVDRKILTSRNPKDIPAFNEAMIKLFGG